MTVMQNEDANLIIIATQVGKRIFITVGTHKIDICKNAQDVTNEISFELTPDGNTSFSMLDFEPSLSKISKMGIKMKTNKCSIFKNAKR